MKRVNFDDKSTKDAVNTTSTSERHKRRFESGIKGNSGSWESITFVAVHRWYVSPRAGAVRLRPAIFKFCVKWKPTHSIFGLRPHSNEEQVPAQWGSGRLRGRRATTRVATSPSRHGLSVSSRPCRWRWCLAIPLSGWSRLYSVVKPGHAEKRTRLDVLFNPPPNLLRQFTAQDRFPFSGVITSVYLSAESAGEKNVAAKIPYL